LSFHSPEARATGKWTETVLYSFPTPKQGFLPNGDLVFDSAGNLYGSHNVADGAPSGPSVRMFGSQRQARGTRSAKTRVLAQGIPFCFHFESPRGRSETVEARRAACMGVSKVTGVADAALSMAWSPTASIGEPGTRSIWERP
jgi:hypothetical protein